MMSMKSMIFVGTLGLAFAASAVVAQTAEPVLGPLVLGPHSLGQETDRQSAPKALTVVPESGVSTLDAVVPECQMQNNQLTVGITQGRLLDRGIAPWGDAYYDNAESEGCQWGNSILAPFGTVNLFISGHECDNDHESGFTAGYSWLQVYRCSNAQWSYFCGDSSGNTTSICPYDWASSPSVTDYQATENLEMAVVDTSGMVTITRPCTFCLRWYFIKVQDHFVDRRTSSTADDVDYGCMSVWWCPDTGC